MIRGERIGLRPLELSDATVITGWHRDREYTRLDGQVVPGSLLQAEQWLRAVAAPTPTSLLFGVEVEGELVGYVSLRRIDNVDRCADFGIALGKAHWNKGYGTDAVRTTLRFAFNDFNLHRVELRVTDYNPRAQHVYEKVGFRVEGRLRETRWYNGAWHDKILMSILVGEFEDAVVG